MRDRTKVGVYLVRFTAVYVHSLVAMMRLCVSHTYLGSQYHQRLGRRRPTKTSNHCTGDTARHVMP